jgi:hypothetical protein
MQLTPMRWFGVEKADIHLSLTNSCVVVSEL